MSIVSNISAVEAICTCQSRIILSSAAGTNLRNPFRRHERSGFHVRDTGLGKSPDELQLCVQRYCALLILQSISWPDFYYSHVVGCASSGGAETAGRPS